MSIKVVSHPESGQVTLAEGVPQVTLVAMPDVSIQKVSQTIHSLSTKEASFNTI